MTVNTRVLQLFMAARPDEHFIQIHRTLRLQVVPDIAALPHCQRHQSAAFISDTATLLVWEDEPTRLLERAEYIQDALMKMSWKSEPVEGEEEKGDGKKPFVQIEEYDEVTEEEAGMEEKPRETVLWQCIYEGATIALVISAIGTGWRWIAIEHVQDPQWTRLLFILCIPPQIWLALVGRVISNAKDNCTNNHSFSFKPSLVISLNYVVLSDRWRETLSTTLERHPVASTATHLVPYLMSPSRCPSIKRVFGLSLNQQFAPSSRLSPHTSSRVAQPTSSLMTTACN